MLTMKTNSLFTLLFVFVMLAGCAGSKKAAVHPLAGMWDYAVDTPEGVYEGTINVIEAEGTLMGSLTNSALSGQMDLNGINFLEDQLSFSFDSGTYGIIDVKVDVDGNTFKGLLTIDGIGEMPITGTKKMSDDM